VGARRLRWAIGVATVVALLVPVIALAAAPRYIVAHGGGLESPRVLADWEANLRLLTESKSGAVVPPERLADREYVELAFFWGPEWAEYADRTNSAAPPLDQANDSGRFYPATASDPAVLEAVFDGVREARVVSPSALAVLTDGGVPVTTSPAPSTPDPGVFQSSRLLLALGVVVLAAVALLLARTLRGRRVGGAFPRRS
jgi:hypothetical protein